jgi:hypothetical protein
MLHTLTLAFLALQPAQHLDGDWEAVELRTEKGALLFEAGGITLHLDRGSYRTHSTVPTTEQAFLGAYNRPEMHKTPYFLGFLSG